MRQSKRLRGCVVVILRAPQCDVRAEERPKRAPTAIRHSYTPRIDEPAAIGEPVKRHVRVTEYDRRLVSIGESVSIALDRRVDEHDLGIAPGAGVAEPHSPQPGLRPSRSTRQIGEQVPMSRGDAHSNPGLRGGRRY